MYMYNDIIYLLYGFLIFGLASCLAELPYGWEKVEDPHYGTYFIEWVENWIRITKYVNIMLGDTPTKHINIMLGDTPTKHNH